NRSLKRKTCELLSAVCFLRAGPCCLSAPRSNKYSSICWTTRVGLRPDTARLRSQVIPIFGKDVFFRPGLIARTGGGIVLPGPIPTVSISATPALVFALNTLKQSLRNTRLTRELKIQAVVV